MLFAEFLPTELSVKVVKIIGSDGRILWFGSMKNKNSRLSFIEFVHEQQCILSMPPSPVLSNILFSSKSK